MIAIDPLTNNVLAVQSSGATLGIYTSAGVPVTSYAAASAALSQIGQIHGIAVDNSGNVFLVDHLKNRIVVFDASMNFQYQFGSSAPATGANNGEFSYPSIIAFDNGGSASASVYVTDMGNNRVQKFTHLGAYVTQWGNFTPTDVAPYYSGLGSVAVDTNNKVYITTSYGSRVFEFDSNGNPVTTIYSQNWNLPVVDDQYRGVAVDLSGNIYVAGGGYPNPRACLRKFDSSGVFIGDTTISGDGSGHLGVPIDVAIDGTGRIYLSDYQYNSIEVYSP